MADTMSYKERVDAAFSFKTLDRVPVMQTEGGVWIADRAGISLAEMYAMDDIGAELIVKGFEDMQCDIVNVNSGCWLAILSAAGCPIDMTRKGSPVEVHNFIEDTDTEIPKLDKSKIKENIANDEHLQQVFQQVRNVKALIGEEKYLNAAVVAPFSAANIMVGTEDFMVMMADEDENIDTIVDYAVEFCAEVTSQLCENGVDMIIAADPNASGDMISQAMYEEVIEKPTREYIAKVRNCKFLCYHICGQTTARLETIKTMGLAGYSFDTPVDVKAAFDVLRGNTVVMGNMDPAGLMLMGKKEDVYKECYRIAELAGLNGGYMMVPGCDIPAASPMENIHCMVNAARDYAATQK